MPLNSQYNVSVSSPEVGAQQVNKYGPTFYFGNSGDFALVILSTNATGWELTVHDADPESHLYPNTKFYQVTPDLADPVGPYINSSDGSAAVS